MIVHELLVQDVNTKPHPLAFTEPMQDSVTWACTVVGNGIYGIGPTNASRAPPTLLDLLPDMQLQ